MSKHNAPCRERHPPSAPPFCFLRRLRATSCLSSAKICATPNAKPVHFRTCLQLVAPGCGKTPQNKNFPANRNNRKFDNPVNPGPVKISCYAVTGCTGVRGYTSFSNSSSSSTFNVRDCQTSSDLFRPLQT